MVNGLGVLGWGVGGIEAEAAMLGQPVSMLVPQVVGYRLTGKLKEGTTATDLVLTITEALRKLGVVGKFVEFYGPGIAELPLADRATIANMAPEYGATCGIFPVDAETLRYLRLTGRTEEHIALVEAYCREQGMFHTPDAAEAEYSATISLDLATVMPSVAGPKRPQDRVLLPEVGASFLQQLPSLLGPNANQSVRQMVRWEGEGGHASADGDVTEGVGSPAPVVETPHVPVITIGNEAGSVAVLEAPPVSIKSRFGIDPDPYLDHGSIVIAAITSCTNTSNPYVMIAAGLLAKKAVEKGLKTPPWVKSSLAPGSRVVTDYYIKVRADAVSRRAALSGGRLWLHDLHRQLGAVADGRQQVDRRPWAGRGVGALGQSQLRGAYLAGGSRELSDESAAGGCVCAGGPYQSQL